MENERPANTPSKLRPPKPRKELNIGPLDTNLENQRTTLKRRIESPPRGKTALPAAIPAPTVAGDRMVKTYKTSAAVTSRPAPVTKSYPRAAPRTAASGRAPIPRTTTDSTESWNQKVEIFSFQSL